MREKSVCIYPHHCRNMYIIQALGHFDEACLLFEPIE